MQLHNRSSAGRSGHSQAEAIAALEASTRSQAGNSTKGVTRFYAPELDVLRFFAFLGVFCFHAAIPMRALAPTAFRSVTEAGRFGVDLFFILSAYLITQLLLRERETRGALDIPRFYLRRVLRIWPLYFFFIALSVFLGWLQHRPLGWDYVTCFVLLSGNWICALKGLPSYSVIFPLWSVSVEEQFYLLWPFAVRSASRRAIVFIAAGLLLVGSAARLLLALHPATFGELEYVSFVRVDGIACGILVAVLLRTQKLRLSRLWRLSLFALGMSLWTVTNYIVDSRSLIVKWSIGYPVIVLSCVIVFVATLGASDVGFLRNRLLIYLGRISYGLYVYHVLALTVAWALMFRGGSSWKRFALTSALGLMFTILLAQVSYRRLEEPFLRLKKRFTYIESGPVTN